jgi:hypothetical protein
MNPETNTTTEMIPLTEAIVTAAKPTRVRKPKTPSIVDEIISDLRSGKYTQESLATLARLFNREFVAEPLVEKKPRKSKKDTPIVETAVNEEANEAPAPKEKKPRKSKKDTPVETTVDEAAIVEAPKEKKPRKSKKDTPVVETTVDNKDTPVDEDASSAVAVKEKKPRKSKKDTPIVETTVDNKDTPVDEDASSAVAVKEKKPRKSKKDTPIVETTVDNKDTSVDEDASSAVAVKEKKPRKSKKETVKASTPVLEPADFIPEMVQELEELPDLASRLEGFLEEEELSDIELDDDDE